MERKGPRNAAIVSCVITALWAAVSVAALILQDEIITYFVSAEMAENSPHAVPFSFIVYALAAMAFIYTDISVIRRKAGLAALLISAVPAGLFHVLTYAADTVQVRLTDIAEGMSRMVRYYAMETAMGWTSYLLDAAAVLTVAAAAVQYGARRADKGNENEA